MNMHCSIGSPVAKHNLTEQALLDDISYLERYVSELGRSTDASDQAMLRTYQRLLDNRRKMLSAWRESPLERKDFVPVH